MHSGITSSNQFGPAKLRQPLPILFENVERIAIFKVLERNDATTELSTEVSGKPAPAGDKPIVVKPVENAQPLRRNLQTCGIYLLVGTKTGENPLCRALWKQFPVH